MIEWNEQRLKELVRKMKLRRAPGQGKTPIHLSLYRAPFGPEPLLAKIMRLDAGKWVALGYDETDRISVIRYLGSLGCRADWALSRAAINQQPLTLELVKLLIDVGASDKGALSYAAQYQQPLPFELAKLLIDTGAFDKETLSRAAHFQQPLVLELAKTLLDAGAFNKHALSIAMQYQRPLTLKLAKAFLDAEAFSEWTLSAAAQYQQPLTLELAKLLIDAGAFNGSELWYAAMFQHSLTLELAKLLIDAGCDPVVHYGNGWDALVCLASDDHSVDPQVTDLFLSAGCRTNLDGCKCIEDEQRLRFDQILKEHAEWKEARNCLLAEHSPVDAFYGPDWGR